MKLFSARDQANLSSLLIRKEKSTTMKLVHDATKILYRDILEEQHVIIQGEMLITH
jgi:hypothetical protein